MKKLLLICFLLSGCSATPYITVGAGYNAKSGWDDFDEECAVGLIATGMEYKGWELEYSHTSCFYEKPEIVTNQYIIKRKFRFGEQP